APTGRGVAWPPDGTAVVRIHDESQVRERVLGLSSRVEAHRAHDYVRDAAPPERVLEHSRLGVGAVKDGDVVPGGAGPARGQDRLGDEAGLLVLVPGAVDGRALALPVLGPEPLVLPRDVVGDHRGGERENPLRRAIVLLEPDDPGARIVRLEVEDVPDVGYAPFINR